MDDLFEKIIEGEIPSAKLYEDEKTFAFLDVNPNNKGHALVVPKTKYRNIFDIEPDVLASMMKTAQRIARALKEALSADGVNITMNNEPAAGQEVYHAHLHVIPRFKDDGVFHGSRKLTYEEGEAEQFAGKIRDHLS